MASSFAWIDNTVDDRRRVLDAIERLKESDARDELGLATVRDGFANTLFPGTGTLQTRAGYFLFVPWLYLDLHRRRPDDIAKAARREEVTLISALLESDDPNGVIGSVAKETLKRLPSSVYWNGLRRWRIFERDLTIDEYHRQFSAFREADSGARDEDEQLLDGLKRRDWNPTIPAPPPGFPKKASFTLRATDRSWLSERIRLEVGDSLLAWLLRHARSLDGNAPWEHPQAEDYPAALQPLVQHARCFSEAMESAPILYNLMLSEQLPSEERREILKVRYRGWFADWRSRMEPRIAALDNWKLSAFWEFTRPFMDVRPGAKAFVEAWVRFRAWAAPEAFLDSAPARILIKQREKQLKGARARLDNPRALELWGEDSGARRLTYRWESARRVLRDLRPELEPSDAQP